MPGKGPDTSEKEKPRTAVHNDEAANLLQALADAGNDQPPEPPRPTSTVGKMLDIWLLPFTRLHRIPVFKRIWFYLFAMALYTIIVDQIAQREFPTSVIKEAGTAAYSGVILGLLLVFRTNAAYERWSEGRRMWGQLTNESRNLCSKVRTLSVLHQSEKTRLGELVISFAYALKHHLRDSTPSAALPGVGTPGLESKNLPVYIAGRIFDVIQEWHQEKRIDGFLLLHLDRHARAFLDVAGACERIRNSPLAVSYRAFMRQGIVLNLLALPWYVAPEFNIMFCLPMILIGTYFLIGLELIAEDIEDPFGYDGDDLPLDNICAGIRSSINDILQVREDRKYTMSFELPKVDPLKAET